jgi:uncharacterized protein with ParB-like and HNH nuclease domain
MPGVCRARLAALKKVKMSIKTTSIGDLKDHRFFVSSYQRGYRWTEHEVTALFDDIFEFSTEGGKRYCIQPLIVKRRGDGAFEVVDGQQRLTTIYIFMKIAAQEIRSALPPFVLEYETRGDSAVFLESLSDEKDLEKEKTKNIDYFHIASAYETINRWFDRQNDKSVAIQKLNTKIRESVFFIWYEIPPETDPISMFTKVNLGKIPLTNAELIKALLLNKDNFEADTYKRQLEISHSWDRIEQGLRDDSFWYFLNEREQSGTRIDMLFELLAKEWNVNTGISEQNYFPFLVFSAALNASPDKERFIKDLWYDVERLYAEFRDWYADLDKYHIIGYLIAVKDAEIADIFTLTRNKRKRAVMKELVEKAEKSIGPYDLDSIFYDNTNDRRKIRKLLLLFNIATLVCKSEKQYRFPFDIYKGETADRIKWDIEHIHAMADETGESDDSMRNLTLLDHRTNRSGEYACKSFNEKRKVVIEREAKGLFVPLCTKNVFLKVYSHNVKDMSKWEDEDKAGYIAAIKDTLNFFFGGLRNERR